MVIVTTSRSLSETTEQKILNGTKWSEMIFCEASDFSEMVGQCFFKLCFRILLNRKPAAFGGSVLGESPNGHKPA